MLSSRKQLMEDIQSLFYNGIHSGNKQKIIELLNGGADPNEKIENNKTLFHCACILHNLDIIDLLLKNERTDIYVEDLNGITAFETLLEEEHYDIINIVLHSSKFDINHKFKNGENTLLLFCLHNYIEGIVFLFDNHFESIDINYQNKNGQSALHCTSNSTIMKMLLDHPLCDRNISNNVGCTPLMCMNNDDIDLVKLMLTYDDIDVNKTNRDNFTALHMAYIQVHPDIVNLLLKCDRIDDSLRDHISTFMLDPNLTIMGLTALMNACQKNELIFVKNILDHPDLDINKKNNWNLTALHIASTHNNIQCVKLLLEHPQIDINSQDDIGWTPMMFAMRMQDIAMFKIFMNHHLIDINIPNKNGNTVLHEAIIYNKIDIVKQLLLDDRTNVNIKNKEGLTPTMVAHKHKTYDILKMISRNERTDINIKNDNNLTLLELACKQSSINTIKCMLECRDDYIMPGEIFDDVIENVLCKYR